MFIPRQKRSVLPIHEAVRGVIMEKFSNDVAYLVRYLRSGIDPYDFAQMLEEYLGDQPEAPAGDQEKQTFEPDDPYEYLENMPEGEREAFKKWLKTRLESMDLGDPTLPTYLFMTFESIVVPSSWLIHFSDDAADIAANGFEYGAEDFTQLGLTTHFSDNWRKKMPGWNFAFSVNDRGPQRGRYGDEAVLFQSGGVRVYHFGDEENQVIFKGTSVERLILLENDGGSWVINNTQNDRELANEDSLNDIINWAIRNERQYSKVIYHDVRRGR